MRLFSILIVVYYLAHLYLWRRIVGLRFLKAWGRVLLLVVLFSLASLPFASRWLMGLQWSLSGKILGIAGFYWLAYVFLLLCVDTVIQLPDLFLTKKWLSTHPSPFWRQPRAMGLSMLLALAITVYGTMEASQVGVTPLKATTPLLSPGQPPIRLLQVSDVHYGFTIFSSRHQHLMETIKKIKPDIIVSTGDFLDRSNDPMDAFMQEWRAITPPMGKYAILGNHEAMIGEDVAIKWLNMAGFRVLRGERVDLGPLVLIGLDDPSTGLDRVWHFTPDSLKNSPAYTILLNHRPGWPPELDGLFDLGLAGHTHGGQIFPFGLVVRFSHGKGSGPTPWGGLAYVSRGTGTWGPPIRVLAPPEVVLLTLEPPTQAGGHSPR